MDEHPVIALVQSKGLEPGRRFTIIADLAAQAGRGGDLAAAWAAA